MYLQTFMSPPAPLIASECEAYAVNWNFILAFEIPLSDLCVNSPKEKALSDQVK